MLDNAEIATDLSRALASAASAGRRRGSEDATQRRLQQPSVRALLSLPVLVAFGLFSSPARAMPAASMQLFRMDNRGVQAVPAISAVLEGPARPAAAPQTLVAQATEASAGALESLSQTFVGALPADLAGNVRLVFVAEDGTLGNILEEIPFSSSRITISADRTLLTVRPSSPIQPGQSVMMQLPSRSPSGTPYVYPEHLANTPCVFKVPLVSTAPVTPAPVPVPAAAGLPAWVYVVGAIVVGVGAAAAAGAFSNGGGSGGSNPSSQ